MNSISQHDSSASERRFVGPRARPAVLAVLGDADRRQLETHLSRCAADGPPYLSCVLDQKIRSSAVLSGPAPSDLVTGGSHVTFAIARQEAQAGLLVHRARTGAVGGVVPVASLLGATLIGMRVGQRAPLLCEDGTIVSLSVLEVARTA